MSVPSFSIRWLMAAISAGVRVVMSVLLGLDRSLGLLPGGDALGMGVLEKAVAHVLQEGSPLACDVRLGVALRAGHGAGGGFQLGLRHGDPFALGIQLTL